MFIIVLDCTSYMMYNVSMSKEWKVVYYSNDAGKCPVKDFLQKKKVNQRAKIMAFVGLLEEQGPLLPRPYADLLKDGIHELRIKTSGNQSRILYFFCYKQYIILTHGFEKTTQKVPKNEIEKA